MRLTPLYAIAIFMFAGSAIAAEETTVAPEAASTEEKAAEIEIQWRTNVDE